MIDYNEESFTPFENIGLCFSGGGYRATFFSLGVLSYLDRIKYKDKTLLDSVKALSTVSGGTLTGVAYAKAIQDPDYNFSTFFNNFYSSFAPDKDELLEKAIAKIENEDIWKQHPHKKRSLINAFALTYSEMPIFEGDFECFKKGNIKQLEQVCFNATDFSFGLTYRFQNEGFLGNNPLYNGHRKKVDALRYKLVLGDIIASSSCFPIGFEPLIFPDDYYQNQNNDTYKSLKSIDVFSRGVGIMDGGIADNQGIDSIIKINERMKDRLGLIMINDVGSYKMEPWEPDNKTLKPSSSLEVIINKVLKYLNLKPIYILCLIIGLTIIISINYFEINIYIKVILNLFGSTAFGVGIVLTLFGLISSEYKEKTIHKIKSIFKKNVPEPLLDDILTFKKIDISLMKRMMTERLTSGSKMINDIFLKQIRRLNYRLLFTNEKLKNKVVTSTVYKLNGKETPYSFGKPKYSEDIKPKPSKKLKEVSLIASETATALWWSEEDKKVNRMDNLIACGQFTTCYELMDYINVLRKIKPLVIKDFKELDKFYEILEEDWIAFNKNPLIIVESIKNK